MKRLGLFLLLVVLLGGCSDVVTSNYKTYTDAVNDHLIDRGWLPECLPSSSFNITTSNNLDLNTSEGEFSFPSVSAESFINRLRPYSGRRSPYVDLEKLAKRRKAEGYAIYEFTKDNYVWVFFLNREKGHAYYYLWSV